MKTATMSSDDDEVRDRDLDHSPVDDVRRMVHVRDKTGEDWRGERTTVDLQ